MICPALLFIYVPIDFTSVKITVASVFKIVGKLSKTVITISPIAPTITSEFCAITLPAVLTKSVKSFAICFMIFGASFANVVITSSIIFATCVKSTCDRSLSINTPMELNALSTKAGIFCMVNVKKVKILSSYSSIFVRVSVGSKLKSLSIKFFTVLNALFSILNAEPITLTTPLQMFERTFLILLNTAPTLAT